MENTLTLSERLAQCTHRATEEIRRVLSTVELDAEDVIVAPMRSRWCVECGAIIDSSPAAAVADGVQRPVFAQALMLTPRDMIEMGALGSIFDRASDVPSYREVIDEIAVSMREACKVLRAGTFGTRNGQECERIHRAVDLVASIFEEDAKLTADARAAGFVDAAPNASRELLSQLEATAEGGAAAIAELTHEEREALVRRGVASLMSAATHHANGATPPMVAQARAWAKVMEDRRAAEHPLAKVGRILDGEIVQIARHGDGTTCDTPDQCDRTHRFMRVTRDKLAGVPAPRERGPRSVGLSLRLVVTDPEIDASELRANVERSTRHMLRETYAYRARRRGQTVERQDVTIRSLALTDAIHVGHVDGEDDGATPPAPPAALDKKPIHELVDGLRPNGLAAAGVEGGAAVHLRITRQHGRLSLSIYGSDMLKAPAVVRTPQGAADEFYALAVLALQGANK